MEFTEEELVKKAINTLRIPLSRTYMAIDNEPFSFFSVDDDCSNARFDLRADGEDGVEYILYIRVFIATSDIIDAKVYQFEKVR